MRSRTAIFWVISLLVGLYYRWGARAAGQNFIWGYELDGYYNLLARGFASGHLYLPAEVNPKLLEKADPWDPAIDDSLKLFDAVLYNRRYYLYHGAGPAVLLFLPWRLLTHHDMPENYASFLFCFGGFLFSAAALLRLTNPRPFLAAVMLIALGFCQNIPFLLNRTWVYEIAIASGYFCISAAAYFYARNWYAACGVACGFAIASRPHLGLFAVAFGVLILLRSRRHLLAFALPFVAAGLAIGLYNYARFGNPAEFGLRYLLTGRNQNRIKLAVENLAPSSYYYLAAAPRLTRLFPWIHLPWPIANIRRPREFFLEPALGIIWLAPFLPALLLLYRSSRTFVFLAIAAGGVYLFLAATGWATQRYEVDFLPMLIFCALAAAATIENTAFRSILAMAVAAGAIVNLAVAVGGPIDEMVARRPDRFVRLSQMFTPIDSYRVRLNPPFSFVCTLSGSKTILSLGTPIYNYELFYNGYAFISRRFGSQVRASAPHPREVTVNYDPASGEINVSESGETILTHKIGALTAAPVELQSACR